MVLNIIALIFRDQFFFQMPGIFIDSHNTCELDLYFEHDLCNLHDLHFEHDLYTIQHYEF